LLLIVTRDSLVYAKPTGKLKPQGKLIEMTSAVNEGKGISEKGEHE